MLEHGKYYHIFNKSVDGHNIFNKNIDYLHFLNLMSIYLPAVSDIYAYALMGNHFHIAVKIKIIEKIGFLNPEYSKSKNMSLKWKTYSLGEINKISQENIKKPDPNFMIQHLCNAYVKWFNKRYNRKGRLLKKSIEEKEVKSINSLRRLILYIHNNPVKHGFCNNPIEYGWTSYITFINNQSSIVKKETVLNLFDNYSNFKSLHNNTDDDFFDINPIIIE